VPAASFINGVIVIDKPAGITSARVVDRVKRLLPRGTKVGHAGTLDPFATGVLVLLVGKATKLCERMMDQPKSYDATLKLGAMTATEDPESPEQIVPNALAPDRATIDDALAHFRGTILQRPPAYSAIRVGGRRAYDLARSGQEVQIQARPVSVYRIDVIKYEYPLLELTIDCGRGTYIRSIARDLGDRLGTGAYLTRLRRTRVGDFTTDDAMAPDSLQRETILNAIRSAH
jgi:tRNA pseudouridine55 synthase